MLQRIHDSLTLGRWVVVIILGLIALTFVFWGIGDFGSVGFTSFAAKVNSEEVSRLDFDNELQARQNRYTELYRTDLTEDVRREMRAAVIEDLVREEALKQRVAAQGYRASNERVSQSIREIAAFQLGGEFSLDNYRGILANAGLTPTGFEEQQRETLELGDLQSGIADSTFFTPAEFRRYIELYNQRREIAYALFDVDAFTADVGVDDAAIAERYASSQASYQTAETVDLEYVELALADIAAGIEIGDEELRRAYEEERERFATTEERKASHILIAIGDDEAAARAAADAAVARLKNGENFAALAAELSADAGSKGQGGELGWFSRGGFLVGPFEDALFALGVGEISEPVRTDQGFHIIRLDELRSGGQQPFEDVREELAADTRVRRAEDLFFERVDELKESAFEAYDTLTPVADQMQLPLKTLDGFARSGDPSVFDEAGNAAVVQAAFAEEIVDSGRNTELVELADDHALVLRVKAHHLPQPKPLDEVREQIRNELTRERALELADAAAQAFLAELTTGGDPVALAAKHNGQWQPAAWVTRSDTSLPADVLTATFGMPKTTAAAPLREAVALAGGGQAVIVLTGVEAGEPTAMSQAERDSRQRLLADQAARAEILGYASSVRASASVRIPDDILEPPIF
jgi:peptidyl-prolyl cis-trans isomerase D